MGKILMVARASALLIAAAAGQAEEPLETRLGNQGAEAPRARLDQVEWLVGRWRGEGIGGAPALENWDPPQGRTMLGTFVQLDEEGEIRFTELMYLREVEGSLELALKHFNPDLTSWEEKEEVERFALVAIEPCAAFFEGLTVRCADPDMPGEGLVVAVRAGVADDGAARELVFRYARAGAGED
jgi:hypothetical protein